MANNYKHRSGDRSDGRLIHSLSGFYKFLPFVMKDKNDAQNLYEQSFEISNAEQWCRQQRQDGYQGMGMLHLFIASYIRCVSQLPGLNRFVVGRRIYARNNIEVVMALKRGESRNSTETKIKVEFDPADTVYDVYNKMNAAVDDVTSSDEGNSAEDFANRLSKFPRFLVRIIMWLISLGDYFSILPKRILNKSPFHGSMIITDLGSMGISPISRHLYNFGTIPLFISLGARYRKYELDRSGSAVERKYIDAKFAMDERTVDGHYYASVFRLMSELIQDPSQLEVTPEIVREDIY